MEKKSHENQIDQLFVQEKGTKTGNEDIWQAEIGALMEEQGDDSEHKELPLPVSREDIKEAHKKILDREEENDSRSVLEIKEFLLFRIGADFYSVALTEIDEIQNSFSLSRVPMVPDYIDGIINLRGRIITVINMKKLFLIADAPAEPGDNTGLIVSGDYGFIIDNLIDVIEFDIADLNKVFEVIDETRLEYFKEVINKDDGLYQIIDVKKLFDSELISGR